MRTVEEKIPLRGHIRYVYKSIGKAIYDFKMIADNDRLLVGVSGGPDSTVLLKVLMMRKRHVPINYHLHACYVKMDYQTADTEKLIRYLEGEGIPVTVKEIALGDVSNRNCFWCSWNRRKALFTAAKELQCNKVVLGHHLDDIVETVLMNMCSQGELSMMRPSVSFFNGEFDLIRPLCYLEKEAVERFARLLRLPEFSHSCPVSPHTARKKVGDVIKSLEAIFPGAKRNIFRSMGNINHDYLL